MRQADLSGIRFGLIVAIKPVFNGRIHDWWCRCDCGTEMKVSSSELRNGRDRCPGCRIKTRRARGGRTEPSTGKITKEHNTWNKMRARCGNPNNRDYRLYGARGISVCERWMSFETFLADMGKAPSPAHSIDRIDSNGNYEPGNCRRATPKQQAQNTSQSRWIEFRGRRMVLADWAREVGITRASMRRRLRAMTIEEALTTPPIRGPRGFCKDLPRSARLRAWETRRAKSSGGVS